MGYSFVYRYLKVALTAILLLTFTFLNAQDRASTAETTKVSDAATNIEKWGKFDNWRVREIKESAIIGGNTKYVYEIAKGDTIKGVKPYMNPYGCVWSNSNVLAIVSGIVKCSNTVFPEKRGDGYCVRLETRIERVKVLGIVNLNVLAAGTVFLGNMHEPIKDTKNPQSKLRVGIPFTGRPKGVTFDYKAIVGHNRVKASGLGKPSPLGDNDYAECIVMLQRRWEDSSGRVYAKRVGTGFNRITESTNGWVNGYTMPIHYGDITKESYYKSYMRLIPEDVSNYTVNSKGEKVPILEVGWADKDEMPTHIIIRFSSSHGDAYIGDPVNRLWIDNVKIAY